MSNMKALVVRKPGDFGLETIPIPQPVEGEVLVKIKGCAICGSDPKIFYGGGLAASYPYPYVPGHEAAGEVVELGPGVSKFKVGDRVAVEAHSGCGYCENCMKGLYTLCLNYGNNATGHRHYGFTVNGAYAEYNTYNIKALTAIPEGVSYEEATMCDTAGTPMNGINLIGITPGGYAVIVGPGPIGLCAMMIAKAKGATTILVGRGTRIQAARKISGCDYTIDFEKEDLFERVREITGGIMADEVIDCAGTEVSINNAIGCARRGGSVAVLGWPGKPNMDIHFAPLVVDQINLQGGRANANCSKSVMNMIASGQLPVKEIMTHEFALNDYQQALDTFTKRIDGALKVIIKP